MNSALDIQQLLILRTATVPEVVARSDGIDFAMEEFARRTTVAYGEPLASTPSFEAIFAIPVDDTRIAVVTATLPRNRPVGFLLTLRFLFVARSLYQWIGDPFAIAERFPANIEARGHLNTPAWPEESRRLRRVEELQRVLKTGNSPLLLGASQAILDGVSLWLVRPEPDREFVRGLWLLLPDSTRGEVWPCEFALADGLPFRIAVLPIAAERSPGRINEEQALDYPEGRYEVALQVAVESGNQSDLDRLLARKSPRDVLRMALVLLAFAALALIAIRFLQ